MSPAGRKQPVDLDDNDNPEWTAADFARAVGPEGLSAAELAAFPNTQVNRGGRPRKDKPKAGVSLRLDPEVLDHLRGSGSGWQTRVNDALAGLIKSGKL
jgi:uncharacterized protein (DUF4415 family)